MKRASALLTACCLALSASVASAQMSQPNMAAGEPTPDRRVGLKAGWFDAATAAWNLRLVSSTPPSAAFVNRSTPGDFRLMNSDIAFSGHYVFQGNFSGLQIWDIADPAHVQLARAFVCPGSQSDVSIYRNLMFVSAEDTEARMDCGTQGVTDSVSHDRVRGVRIFDISDVTNPRYITSVQTCRGSHTHTVVPDPRDSANIYVYISGSAPVRSPSELAGCSALMPDQDPNSALFRIEVIRVPLAHPEQAAVVSSPRIFHDLAAPAEHGDAPEDTVENARRLAEARAHGGFIVTENGRDHALSPMEVGYMLGQIVRERGGGQTTPTAADSAALHAMLEARARARANAGAAPRMGPTQCHDITVYPAVGLAGGACGGYGLLLDIHDPANPQRIAAVADSNFSYWHSATFNNDGTKVLFSDEWGGGLQPRCRVTDKHEWGADAIFTIANRQLTFHGYYKLPAAQTPVENCVAHNGSLIPVPGRDIMAQGWYQGGISVFDWTDAAHPVEIAYFDRGPMDSTVIQAAGSWSAYWYNGNIYSSEIARGLDIFELQPSTLLSQNEIDAAKLVRTDFLNVQSQQRIVWPASFVVARAYVDQLERSHGLSAQRITAVRGALTRAEGQHGQARRSTLTQLASQLSREAGDSTDAAKVRTLAGSVQELAAAAH